MQRWELILNIGLGLAILVLVYLVACVGSRPVESDSPRDGAGETALAPASTGETVSEGGALPETETRYGPDVEPGSSATSSVETPFLPSNESLYNAIVKPTPQPTPKLVAQVVEVTPAPTPRNRYPDLVRVDPFRTIIPKPTPVVTPAPTPRPPPPLQQVVSTLKLVMILGDSAIVENRNGGETIELTVGGKPYRIAYKTWGFDLFLIRVDDSDKFEIELKSDKHEDETVTIRMVF